jgi:hypothetical protein
MKNRNQQPLTQRYAELFNEQNTPEDTTMNEVIACLDHTYTPSKQPEKLSWSEFKTYYSRSQFEKQATLPSTLFRPAQRLSLRLSIVVVVLLVMLLTIGTVYAQINGLLQNVINLDPGASQLQQTNQLVSTNGTQTLHGFTVTTKRVYADNNRVIVVYSVQSQAKLENLEGGFFSSEATMYYQQSGNHYQSLKVLGGLGLSDNAADGTLASFDTSSIQGNPTTLHLKFVIAGIEYIQFVHQTNVQHFVHGPFTFAFSVPFHTGKTFVVGQSQTSRDGTISIGKVRVSASEVRIYTHQIHWHSSIGYALTMSTSKNVPGVSYLTLANDTHHYLLYGTPDNAEGSAFSLLIPADLINASGPWTLHLLFSDMKQPGKIVYTMTFSFAVPNE